MVSEVSVWARRPTRALEVGALVVQPRKFLDYLEWELTLIESDDESLVRVATGRNVVPSINAEEPIVVQSDSLATVPASPRALQGVARWEVPDVAPPTATWVDRDLDESSSVQSESCWGEMEDRNDEEVEEWGLVRRHLLFIRRWVGHK